MDLTENMIVEIPKDVETLQLPDPSLLLYYKNYKDRIVYMDFEIGVDAYEIAKELIRWNLDDKDIPVEERKPIRLMLFNGGGSADVMMCIYDIIKSSKTPIYGYNLGLCASAAFWIFAGCHRRFMMKNANVLIHDGSAEFSNTGSKILDNMKEYKKTIEVLQNMILENTKIPKATLTKKWKDEWNLGADECLKYEICDKIVDSLDELYC